MLVTVGFQSDLFVTGEYFVRSKADVLPKATAMASVALEQRVLLDGLPGNC